MDKDTLLKEAVDCEDDDYIEKDVDYDYGDCDVVLYVYVRKDFKK